MPLLRDAGVMVRMRGQWPTFGVDGIADLLGVDWRAGPEWPGNGCLRGKLNDVSL
jgi:hypothetical protein